MFKQYIIKYKLFGMPYYYEFRTYSENSDSAISAFIKEYPIGIERYYIAAILDI